MIQGLCESPMHVWTVFLRALISAVRRDMGALAHREVCGGIAVRSLVARPLVLAANGPAARLPLAMSVTSARTQPQILIHLLVRACTRNPLGCRPYMVGPVLENRMVSHWPFFSNA